MKLIQLLLLTSIFYTIYLLASSDKKPVDEGQKNIHKEDKIKGATTVTNSYEYKKISLSSIKKTYSITGTSLSHAPFTCLYYDGKKKETTTIATEKNNDINFTIQKSLLKVEDKIFIINDLDSKDKNNPKGKYVIIEIEVIE